ncbi:inverse autotransporter beta domain-containing protein [Orbaceae bacterium ESL0721]|nr:inverse autotransporter beta domain-containing protein [Orbaceae bacterium ESL0721]
MKKNLNLTSIAAFIIVALSSPLVFASTQSNQSSNAPIDTNKIIELKNGVKVREMINNKQHSLYQIALLSNISIAELREINAGRFNKKDVVEVGERLILPIDSPLLPPIVKVDDNLDDKYKSLPELSSTDLGGDGVDTSDAAQVAAALQMAAQNWEQLTSSGNTLSSQLKTQGQDYATDYVRSGVQSQVIDPIRSAAQDFLGRFGTAQLQFNVGDEGKFNNFNVKLFSPWYDSETMLLFSQLTFQEYENERRIGNFGIGQRFEVADKKWLLGYNVFFDHDFQRSHNRLGIGAEAWTDNMKFAANYYHPLSSWKQSRDFDEYLERAAKGFDVRFQGYLPQYPHLGASFVYEQYFGDKVALFGKDNLQKNPRAVTLGLDYTPVPLFTVKADHKRGQDGKKDTRAQLTMNYRIGTPFKDQIDPSMVQNARSLKGSRYDLVDRNNYIVLEYKEKKMSVDLGLERVQIQEGQTMPVSISLHNAHNINQITWTGDLSMTDPALSFLCYNYKPAATSSTDLCSASGSSWFNTTITDVQNWSVVAPSYLSPTGQKNPVNGPQKNTSKYSFAVTVANAKGKTASSNTVTFEVVPDYQARKVKVEPIWGGITQPSGAEIAAGRTITVQGSLMNNNVPFRDESLVYPTEVTKAFIDELNSSDNPIWLAVDANGNRIPFGFNNTCPTGKDECLLVTAVKKDLVNNGDVFSIDFTATARLGVVKVTLGLGPYSDTTSINISGGIPKFVDIIHVSKDKSGNIIKHELVSTIGHSLVASGVKLDKLQNTLSSVSVSTDNLVLGDSYYALAVDVDGRQIDDRYIQYDWSLVSANGKTCETDGVETAVDADPITDSDKILNSIDYAYSTKYIPKERISPNLTGSNKAIRASCAGDQGYVLKVTATNK